MTRLSDRKRLTREESRAQTRERLLDAGRQLVVANGYGGASLRDIAAQAGYSQGAFYSNFASKEALLLELLWQHMGAQEAQLAALLAAPQTPEQRLAQLERWARTLNQDADWCTLSIELQLHAQRSQAFAVEYQKVWDAHRAALGRFIGQLFDALGHVPPASPDELAAGFMALSHGLALQAVATRTETSGRLIMVLLRGLIASAADAPGGAGRADH